MKILYKFASKSRKEKFFKVIDNITSLARHDSYLIFATLDLNDSAMFNDEVINRMNEYKNVSYSFGYSKNKVDAINRDMDSVGDFNLLINVSDDQLFLVEGFDKIIIQDYIENFHTGDAVLHYPDSHAGSKLMTMSIMDYKYYKRFNYIYFHGYASLYSDNEAMDVARILGRYKFFDKKIFDHFHPAWGMAEMDDQYRHTESFYKQDGELYQKRKARNFDLSNDNI